MHCCSVVIKERIVIPVFFLFASGSTFLEDSLVGTFIIKDRQSVLEEMEIFKNVCLIFASSGSVSHSCPQVRRGEAKRPLSIEIVRRDEGKHVGLDRRKPTAPIFKAQGQMVTSEVTSMT